MTKKILSLLIISCLSISLISCGKSTENTTTSSNNTISTEDSKDTTSSKDTEDKQDDNNEKNDSEKEDASKKEEENTEVSLSLYSADVDSLELTKIGSLKVEKDAPLKDKLDKLASELSKNVFSSLPITVTKIETIDGKKIATVNLSETNESKQLSDLADYNGDTWLRHKLQGSTGASVTSKSLIETFLQRDYTGEWIDGVKFTYEGEEPFFEHALNLSETNYR